VPLVEGGTAAGVGLCRGISIGEGPPYRCWRTLRWWCWRGCWHSSTCPLSHSCLLSSMARATTWARTPLGTASINTLGAQPRYSAGLSPPLRWPWLFAPWYTSCLCRSALRTPGAVQRQPHSTRLATTAQAKSRTLAFVVQHLAPRCWTIFDYQSGKKQTRTVSPYFGSPSSTPSSRVASAKCCATGDAA